MEVLYQPPDNKNNKYIELSKKAIQLSGATIIPFTFRMYLKQKRKLKKARVAIFNWFENIYDTKNKIHIKYEILKHKIIIFVLKLNKIKIVQTFHNKQQHNLTDEVKKLTTPYVKWLYKKSDKIIILSTDSKKFLRAYLSDKEIEEKSYYIPHPNYIGAYRETEIVNEPMKSDRMKILFVGAISPYKNIDMIMDIAEELSACNIEFNIWGSCKDENYKKELFSISEKIGNVNLHFGFVPDEDIADLIQKNDIMLLPYDIESSMNSGSAILAFSNKRTVICPKISTILEFNASDIYSYDYVSKEDHVSKLRKTIENAYTDWINDRDSIDRKGLRLYEQVKKDNSIEELSILYHDLFDELGVWDE